MNRNFMVCAVFALGGVVLFSFGNIAAAWAGAIVVLGAISWYFWILKQARKVSEFEIDNIYYLGFLVTIFTLAATIIYIARKENLSEHQTQIIFQFGVGLIFTGIALFFRLVLLGQQEERKERDVNTASAELAENIDKLSKRFALLSNNISGLAENAEKRSATLMETFDTAETNLRERLDKTADVLEKVAIDSMKRSLAREEQLKKELADATLTFNENLAQLFKDSLAATSQAMHGANQQFADNINALADEMTRIKKEAEAISFKKAAQRMDEFADAIEHSLASITAAVSAASQESSGALKTLTASAKKTQALAAEIAAHLDNLKNVERIVAHIDSAGNGLANLSTYANQSGHSLAQLSSGAQMAAGASGHFGESAQRATDSIKDVTATVDSLRTVLYEMNGQLEKLQYIEKLAAHINGAAEGLDRLSADAVQSGKDLTGLSAQARIAADASEQLAKNARGASGALGESATANAKSTNSLELLADTATDTHKLANDIMASLRELNALLKEIAATQRSSKAGGWNPFK